MVKAHSKLGIPQLGDLEDSAGLCGWLSPCGENYPWDDVLYNMKSPRPFLLAGTREAFQPEFDDIVEEKDPLDSIQCMPPPPDFVPAQSFSGELPRSTRSALSSFEVSDFRPLLDEVDLALTW